MQVVERDGVFYVSGDITESCSFDGVKIPPGPVRMDLAGVRTINSCGVREWISSIAKLKIQPIYISCPQAVVMQLNMVREFLEGATVESFQVPTYCEACGQTKTITLKSGVDFKPGVPLADFGIKKCEKTECAIEPDVDPDSYFFFIEDLK